MPDDPPEFCRDFLHPHQQPPAQGGEKHRRPTQRHGAEQPPGMQRLRPGKDRAMPFHLGKRPPQTAGRKGQLQHEKQSAWDFAIHHRSRNVAHACFSISRAIDSTLLSTFFAASAFAIFSPKCFSTATTNCKASTESRPSPPAPKIGT